MNWLVLAFYLTAGVNFHQNVKVESTMWAPPDNSFVTILGAEIQALDNHLFISAEVKTQEVYFKGFNFAPFVSEYNVKVGARFGGFEIGGVDDCTHPTLSDGAFKTKLFGGWCGMYVSFKGSCKIF
jgi:hypothetical protein